MMFTLPWGLTLAGDDAGREVEAPEEAEGQEEENTESSGRWAAGLQLGGMLGGSEWAPSDPPTPLFALAERSNVLQRALNTLRFLWLLCQALVDGLTQWLDACTREHTDMSRILLLERCVLAQRLAGVSPGGRWGTGVAPHGGTDALPAAGRGDKPRVPG